METPTADQRTPLLGAEHRSAAASVQPINASTADSIWAEEGANETTTTAEAASTSPSLGFFAVVFLTVNATLGAGLLNIPYAFSQSGGIGPATAAQVLHVILVIISLLIISGCSGISQSDSLQGIVHYFCGPKWRHACSLFIVLYSYGACVTYVIIIGDQFNKFFGTFYPDLYGQHWYFNGDILIITVSTVTILPLCFSKHISFLKFASFFGFCCTTYLTILVLVEYIKVEQKQHVPPTINVGPEKWNDIFNVIPVLTFSYQCQLSWVPTYAQIKHRRSYWRLFGMIIVSMLICFISYTWTAVFGLLAFGSDHIEKDIMQNYNPKDPFVSFAMILLIVKTIVVYPVLLFCGRIVLEEFIADFSFANRRPLTARVCIATVWVLSSCTLAILVPNIAVVINYLGSLAIFFVFIFPGLSLYQSLFNLERLQAIQVEFPLLRRRLAIFSLAVLFISYGTFILVISVYQSYKQTTSSQS